MPEITSSIYSSSSLRGSYSPSRFVMRLRDDIFDLIEGGDSGVLEGDSVSLDRLMAFSTYFHETIHWWQHVGSTSGLMMSLAFPAQSHVNKNDLQIILDTVGPCKPILKIMGSDRRSGLSQTTQASINRVVNNWHDIEFNVRITLDPVEATSVFQSPYFLSVGHCMQIGLGNMLWLLSSTVDRDCKFLPDIRKWEGGFEDLRRKKVKGHERGGPVSVVSIGARRILEGQARFCQLQYLYMATSGQLSWAEFKSRGMMSDLYTAAFSYFLELAELPWPDTPTDPIVNAFLLVCDLAINPSEGFPFDLYAFESFIISVDPGFRFFHFSRELSRQPSLIKGLQNCSDEEYVSASDTLCESLICPSPYHSSCLVTKWFHDWKHLRELMVEDQTFAFPNINLPARLLFARFVAFAMDRAQAPAFFCWPAAQMVGRGRSDPDWNTTMSLWSNHQPLFHASLSGEIRPMLLRGRTEENIYQTFNNFYSWNILYDLTRQWIVGSGPFDFDFSWLTPRYAAENVKPLVDEHFKEVFGVSTDDFKL